MAIIGILFCHASAYFVMPNLNNPNLYVAAFFDCLRDFSIPIFVMLSGALLLNRSESFKLFFKKRLSRLFIPFIFWTFIYILYLYPIDLKGALDIFLGAPGTLGVAFWFIWMILVMYIGIFIINKAISIGSKSIDNFSDILIYILTGLSLLYFAISRIGLFNPYSSKIIYFASFITYIIIGYFIAKNDFVGPRIGINKTIAITSIASVLLYLYYICYFVVPNSMASNSFAVLGYFNPFLLILSVNVFIMFKYLSKTTAFDKVEKSKLGLIILKISKYSFGIYLIHYLILYILRLNILTRITNPNPLLWIILLVVLTLIISLAILEVLDRIPYLNVFSGKG